MVQGLSKKGFSVNEAPVDSVNHGSILAAFERLKALPSWGNGRDVGNVVDGISRTFYQRDSLTTIDSKISLHDVMIELQKLIEQRESRVSKPIRNETDLLERLCLTQQQLPPSASSISMATKAEEKQTKAIAEAAEAEVTVASAFEMRDAGVSDTVWDELEISKLVQIRQEVALEAQIQRASEAAKDSEQKAERNDQEMKRLGNEAGTHDDNDDERKRLKEALRLKMLKERQAADAGRAKLEKALKDAEEERRQDQKAQTKLRDMGVCVAGYRWIRQAGGYRCAGGSHFVNNAALGI